MQKDRISRDCSAASACRPSASSAFRWNHSD